MYFIISLLTFTLLGHRPLYEREWAIIQRAGPVRTGRCHKSSNFLVLGHAGFLTMFSFTVLRAAVMKLITQSNAPALVRIHNLLLVSRSRHHWATAALSESLSELDIGEPNSRYTYILPVIFKPHVIGSEPISINWVQI